MCLLAVHSLASSSPNVDAALLQILALSNAIFSAQPDSKYASLAIWRERLSHQDAQLIYLTLADATEPIAFLFAHPRLHDPPLPVSSTTESLHVWLAGVLPEYRKHGCLALMMAKLAMHAARPLTVCTTPATYPDMYRWLVRNGWLEERGLADGKLMLAKVLLRPAQAA